MVDNEADSVKVSESAEPPLCIFKVYIITIMGHLNIALYPYYICKNLRCLKISWRRCRRSPCGIYYFPLCKDTLFFWGRKLPRTLAARLTPSTSRDGLSCESSLQHRPPCPCKVSSPLSIFLLLRKSYIIFFVQVFSHSEIAYKNFPFHFFLSFPGNSVSYSIILRIECFS